MADAALVWRAESAFTAAWPALREAPLDGWTARFADGVSRRSNSLNPLGPASVLTDPVVDRAEQLYRAEGATVFVRLLSVMDPQDDRRLASRGYEVEAETLSLIGPLDAAAADPEVEITAAPTPEWLALGQTVSGRSNGRQRSYAAVLERLQVPAGFALLRHDGEPAAVAYAAVHEGIACLESVGTGAEHRGRGFGRRLVAALMAWGSEQGAGAVGLQVQAGNSGGLALYRSLGLSEEIYRYHYRRAPEPRPA